MQVVIGCPPPERFTLIRRNSSSIAGNVESSCLSGLSNSTKISRVRVGPVIRETWMGRGTLLGDNVLRACAVL